MICISKESLLREIGDAAFVEADLREGERDAHALHQTYDICNEENLPRVDNLLRYAYAEACRILRNVGRDASDCGSDGSFRFETTLIRPAATLLRSALREYLVASVVWGWLRSALPEAAGSWKQRREEAFAAMRGCGGGVAAVYRRRVEPF